MSAPAIVDCSRCAFYAPGGDGYAYGECRRRAPLPLVSGAAGVNHTENRVVYWPVVEESDGCGDGTAKVIPC